VQQVLQSTLGLDNTKSSLVGGPLAHDSAFFTSNLTTFTGNGMEMSSMVETSRNWLTQQPEDKEEVPTHGENGRNSESRSMEEFSPTSLDCDISLDCST
jgi:hypothetical protein